MSQVKRTEGSVVYTSLTLNIRLKIDYIMSHWLRCKGFNNKQTAISCVLMVQKNYILNRSNKYLDVTITAFAIATIQHFYPML